MRTRRISHELKHRAISYISVDMNKFDYVESIVMKVDRLLRSFVDHRTVVTIDDDVLSESNVYYSSRYSMVDESSMTNLMNEFDRYHLDRERIVRIVELHSYLYRHLPNVICPR